MLIKAPFHTALPVRLNGNHNPNPAYTIGSSFHSLASRGIMRHGPALTRGGMANASTAEIHHGVG